MKAWIEAIRLRTLPVSAAGVLAATALAVRDGSPRWGAAALCLAFALLAQIASNFANEYYDWRDGVDRPGREGFRRGVTEGDISPLAMKRAIYITLALAACCGLGLVAYGGWWLIPVGAAIGLGALSYSAGPYPLSRHALGEVAVFVFFGLVPVTLTYYVQTGTVTTMAWRVATCIGLMGANILIVNNYRDADDDRAVGKMTIAVKFGRKFASALYLVNAFVACMVMADYWKGWANPLGYVLFIVPAFHLWEQMRKSSGRELNPILGRTAMLMFLYALVMLLDATQ